MTERFEVDGIVQLGPDTLCPGGLAVITEIRSWGVICYIQLPGPCDRVTITVKDNRAWFRLAWEQITATGGLVHASGSACTDQPTEE